MTPRRACGLLAAIVFVGTSALAPASAEPTPLVAVSYAGTIYEVDRTTGAGTAIGRCRRVRLNSMAALNGTLYSASDPDVGPDALVTVDPATGLCEQIATIDLGAAEESVRGMAFAGSALYLVNNGGCRGCVFDSDVLYAFDLTTGHAQVIGDIGFSSVQGLAISSGVLYGWDTDEGLVTIDRATGVGFDVNPSEPASVSIQTLASRGVRMYGAQDQLYAIDVLSGAATAIGGGGYHDVRGLG